MVTSTTVPVTMVTASTGTVTYTVNAADTSNLLLSGVSGGVTVLPGTAQKLLVILQGEDFRGGTASGKTGTPVAQTAGTAFSVTGAICDAYWNRAPNTSVVMQVNAPLDTYGVAPASAPVDTGSGTRIFTFGANSLMLATTQYIKIQDVDNIAPLYWANNSSTFTVNAASR